MLNVLATSAAVSVFVWAVIRLIFGDESLNDRTLRDRVVRIGTSYNLIQKSTKKKEIRPEQTIDAALKELEAARQKRTSWSIRMKLRQAGIGGSPAFFVARVALIVSAVPLLLLFLGLSLFQVMAIWLFLTVLTVYGYLDYLIKKRITKISVELPIALDVVYRALRAGLPTIEAIKLSESEIGQPLKSELGQILRDMSIGIDFEEAVQRFAKRVPTHDVSFFATVISIQAKTGGNMSTAIANLVSAIREREKLQSRVRTVTAEVRSSAKIIAALPIVAISALMLIAPDFTDILFETTTGNQILIGCALWMGIGMVTLRKMTKIDL
ncbi:type II secretion system F family protein [Ponticoccus sp. SC2-23]|nr:type II secretion system F family protein [Ponticoccus sp. SC6-9]MBM1227476.1 type II secretion system F family protein [Ponticoccus sp. SC6-15]MBM1231994.1 type II secretion system F family protein [Ponticoccus sp. SC6-38]MBM1236495.1 type II secretion system F family protein [Ponticoccus sp. SC6-45]MBM1241011.1 type II secretion system F family protein [Ponticoccus sp. SC6-49]MBM1245516.1 type II secretion system F family protein [Ponticoccus sp. SC2-64]MBM1245551.1 type II secretion sys